MTCPNCGAETSAYVCQNCGGAVPAPGPTAMISGSPPIPTPSPAARQIVVAEPVEARNWATGVHLSALLGMFFPFANLIAPLVVWLLKRDESPLIDREGKEAVNFQISMTMYMAVSGLLVLLLIGLPMLFVVAILDLIFTIVAAVKTSNGEQYRYPLTIRFIR